MVGTWPDEQKAKLAEAVERSDARLAGLTQPIGHDSRGIADRLVADYQFAVEATDVLELPKPFPLVLSNELQEIRRSRHVGDGRRGRLDSSPLNPPTSRTSPWDQAFDAELCGLAFSGGGIRSATFGLGVMQSLANLDLLRQFDYLSTVSGGGYIGSWLAAWIKRLNGGVREAQQRLCPPRGALPTEVEARPIRMLREYSNYLTPSTGFLSADTWTAIAVWVRNAILNQLVLLSFIAAGLLVPWLFLTIAADRQAGTWSLDGGLLWIQLVLAVAVGAALWAIIGSLRDFDDEDRRNGGVSPGGLGWTDRGIATVVGGALVAGIWATAYVILAMTTDRWELYPMLMFGKPAAVPEWLSVKEWQVAVTTAVALLFGLLLIQVGGRYARCVLRPRGLHDGMWDKALATAKLAACAPLPAVVGGLLAAKSHELPSLLARWAKSFDEIIYQIVFLPPLLMQALALAIVLHIGLLGRDFPDERREWWSRLGAHQLRLVIAWMGLGVIALLLPAWLGTIDWKTQGVSVVTWLATTFGGVAAAQSSATGNGDKRSWKTTLLNWLARLAPYVFVLGLLVAVSVLVNRLVVPASLPVAAGIVVLAGIGLLLSWRFDINEFSLHHFYKNRLVRCYLGASRDGASRRPNLFTGFDANDDVKLERLRTTTYDPRTGEKAYVGPFPVINTALNLTKGTELAWQERKAESFVFTPLACGYELTADRMMTGRRHLRRAGYRPTSHFAYPGGPGLGTAVAISGAAANPNMGYHSSPAVAFLLTVFNVRLGWWVGNTRYASRARRFVASPWRKPSPTIGAIYLLKELFGRTDDQSQYVNVSDGGHFDNLGVYELVRRRCKYIVAVDAEQDGLMALGGLAGVIRKCRADFGVAIDLDTTGIKPGLASQMHCAVGTINYPERPGDPGWLLYLKSSLTGDESPDVLEYRQRDKTFPHQSTGDQWFDESQFESYRTLGYHVAQTALSAAAASRGKAPTFPQIFSYLRELWTPLAVSASPTRHAEAYATLLERAYDTPAGAASIDPVLFPKVSMPPPANRDELYMSNAIIDLMHTVFKEMDLDRFGDRPHNEGWMRIFKSWAGSPTVKAVWKGVRDSYSTRFQRFMDDF